MSDDLRPWVLKTPLWMLIALAWVIVMPINVILSMRRAIILAVTDTVTEVSDIKRELAKAKDSHK